MTNHPYRWTVHHADSRTTAQYEDGQHRRTLASVDWSDALILALEPASDPTLPTHVFDVDPASPPLITYRHQTEGKVDGTAQRARAGALTIVTIGTGQPIHTFIYPDGMTLTSADFEAAQGALD